MLLQDAESWVPTAEFSGDMAAPASIEALLAARLDLLPMSERTVVEAASVIGFPVLEGAVAELTPDAAAELDERLARNVERRVNAVERSDRGAPLPPHHDQGHRLDRLPKRTRSTLHSRSPTGPSG